MWSSGPTNWESRAWVLSFAVALLFCTERPWAGWIWAGFLDLRDRQISRLPGSMFVSGQVAKGWRAVLEPKQDCHTWTVQGVLPSPAHLKSNPNPLGPVQCMCLFVCFVEVSDNLGSLEKGRSLIISAVWRGVGVCVRSKWGHLLTVCQCSVFCACSRPTPSTRS